MSVTQLPRYPVPGYEEYTPEEAAELLHREKNAPEGPPTAVLRKLKPFGALTLEERLFPQAMYREWREHDRLLARHRAAGRLQMNLTNPLEADEIDKYIGAYESINAISRPHHDDLKAQGWHDTLQAAKDAAFLAHRELATDAALSMHDDRHLSETATAQREAVEDAADDHVTEIPRAPIPSHRKRGRPRKEERA